MPWIDAMDAEAVEEEDVARWDHGERTYAIYRSPEGDRYYCTDGLCTHQAVHLADGLVLDETIECPMHNGRFDYRSGRALRAPACEDLGTYPVKVEAGRVMVLIE